MKISKFIYHKGNIEELKEILTEMGTSKYGFLWSLYYFGISIVVGIYSYKCGYIASYMPYIMNLV